MSTSGRFLAIFFGLLAFMGTIPQAQAQVNRQGATNLILYNASNNDVTAIVKLPNSQTGPNQDGCPNGSVAAIKWIDVTNGGSGTQNSLTIFGGNAFQGFFTLQRGHKVQLLNVGMNPKTNSPSSCFQGLEVGFGAIPLVCPDWSTGSTMHAPNTTPGPNFGTLTNVSLPNGSNGFECTLNVPGTAGGQTIVSGAPVANAEACDISCVNGVNAQISMQMTPPAGGPYWQAQVGTGLSGSPSQSTTFTGPASTQNSWLDTTHGCDNNCVDPTTGYARPGVYPYGCTMCNVFPDTTTTCASNTLHAAGQPHQNQYCGARNGLPGNTGCLYTRAPANNTPQAGISRFGGTLLCTYMGPSTPPGQCP